MLVLVAHPLHEGQLQRIRDAAPSATIVAADRDDPRYRELLARAEVAVDHLSRDELAIATNLRWLHSPSVGTERQLAVLPPHVTLTNGRGTFGYVVAEHALALLLALVRDLHRFARATTWNRDTSRLRTLRGKTLLVLGAGDIGEHVARYAQALGMHTLGVNRTGGDARAPFDELHPLDRLDALLPRAEAVVNALPATPETRGFLDARRLALLPAGALVVNVGRGSTIDQAALVDALRDGRLGGAGLDVTEPEPLPPDHPLWTLPNVLIAPHVGGMPGDADAVADLVADNLARYLAGRPLRNVVSREHGY